MRFSKHAFLALVIVGLSANKCPKATKNDDIVAGTAGKVEDFGAARPSNQFVDKGHSEEFKETTKWMTQKGFDAALELGKLTLDSDTGIYRHANGTGWNPERPESKYPASCWGKSGNFTCDFRKRYPPAVPEADKWHDEAKEKAEAEKSSWWRFLFSSGGH